MFDNKCFIREGFSIDRLTAITSATSDISTLQPSIVDDSMNNGMLVMQYSTRFPVLTIVPGTQGSKVLARFRCLIIKQFEY